MTSVYKVALLSVLLWLPRVGVGAESKPIELRWSELAGTIGGHKVELLVTEGARVRGDVISVRADSLLLDVSSGSAGYAKGNSSIARTSVKLIMLERTHGTWGRSMGTTLGMITGLVVGGYVAGTATNSAGAGIPLFLGMAGGTTVGGYYIGKGLDTKVTLIKIVPERGAGEVK